jgi:hypothetical protein
MAGDASLLRRQGHFLASLFAGLMSVGLTAALLEALGDRDWSLQGREWFDVLAISLVLILLVSWVLSLTTTRVAPEVERHRRQRQAARSRATIDDSVVPMPVAPAEETTTEAISKLLCTSVSGWAMPLGDRAGLEGMLAALRPRLSIEIGTHRGGSLEPISRYSDAVHTFDTSSRPEVVPGRFSNVMFHVGDSHRLLAPVLAGFAAEGRNVDFVLVDGDHSTSGTMRDVVDLLSSPAVGCCIILVHDAIHPRVRNALEQIDYDSFGKVSMVEPDFIQGFAMREGEKQNQAWNGLALIVTGWDLPGESVYPRGYPAFEVWEAFSRSLGEHDPITAAQVAYVERQFETQRNLVQLMEQSLSWRVTAPLRAAKRLVRSRS